MTLPTECIFSAVAAHETRLISTSALESYRTTKPCAKPPLPSKRVWRKLGAAHARRKLGTPSRVNFLLSLQLLRHGSTTCTHWMPSSGTVNPSYKKSYVSKGKHILKSEHILESKHMLACQPNTRRSRPSNPSHPSVHLFPSLAYPSYLILRPTNVI